MSLTIEQVARQQQEVITLQAQVADQAGLSEAVRTTNNLCCSPSSVRHSESHLCEGARQAEGVHWQGGRCSEVVEENGSVL